MRLYHVLQLTLSSQAVSRQLQIAEVQIRSQGSLCRVCVGQCGTGTSLSTHTSLFPFQFSFHQCPIFILINLRSKLYSFHTQTSKNSPQQLIHSLVQATVYPATKGVRYSKVFSILCLTTDVSMKVMRKKSVTSARSPRNTSAQPGDRYGVTSR